MTTLSWTDITWQKSALPINGVNVIQSVYALAEREDWSKVRSPGRARRRKLQGHRQNIRIVAEPAAYTLPNGDLVIHPTVYAQLKQKLAQDMQRRSDQITRDLILGVNQR